MPKACTMPGAIANAALMRLSSTLSASFALDNCLSREQALATAARHQPHRQLSAARSILEALERAKADRRCRPFARRLHGAVGRRRKNQSGKISRVPARLAQQSDGAGLSAQRIAARRSNRWQPQGRIVPTTTNRATSSPPPLAGEGQGGGTQQGSSEQAHPLPNPPPQAGEGADRVCRSRGFYLAKTLVLAIAMAAIRSIVHPTDFSDLSATAFAHALRIALAARSKLSLLHVSQYDAAEALAFPHARRLLTQWGLSAEDDAPWVIAGKLGIEV